MAKQQDQLQALNAPYTTPIIMEHDDEGKDIYDGGETPSGGCFRLFCCLDSHNHHRHDGTETATFLHQNPTGDLINQDTWLMKRAKSVKEYSELVAGPKWKNFIRRFSRRTKTRSNATTAFQYDLQSYALNFNDGDNNNNNNNEDDDLLPRSFSTRFAPPSRSTRA